MSENGDKTTGRRDRSPQFPALPLKVALERLVSFESHFKRSAARPENMGSAWGVSKPYADRIVAALRYYGLLDYNGAGKERQIVVSEKGRNILRAQQDEVKQRFIKEAALSPKQIGFFWDEWGEDRPSDSACLDNLVLDHNFSDRGAKVFLRVYDNTISFAGLSKSDKKTPEDLGGGAGNAPEADSADDIKRADTSLRIQRPRVQRQKESGMKEDVFTLDEGDAVLQWPATLSSESYDDLKDWLSLMLRKIERQSISTEDSNQSSNSSPVQESPTFDESAD